MGSENVTIVTVMSRSKPSIQAYENKEVKLKCHGCHTMSKLSSILLFDPLGKRGSHAPVTTVTFWAKSFQLMGLDSGFGK